jgi:hypothetical protein
VSQDKANKAADPWAAASTKPEDIIADVNAGLKAIWKNTGPTLAQVQANIAFKRSCEIYAWLTVRHRLPPMGPVEAKCIAERMLLRKVASARVDEQGRLVVVELGQMDDVSVTVTFER